MKTLRFIAALLITTAAGILFYIALGNILVKILL